MQSKIEWDALELVENHESFGEVDFSVSDCHWDGQRVVVEGTTPHADRDDLIARQRRVFEIDDSEAVDDRCSPSGEHYAVTVDAAPVVTLVSVVDL